ncbi:hypothetical protein KGY73_06130 [bacterium]|nr:hypothetical protein [bacterium]
MKLKGFLVILILVGVGVYFLYMMTAEEGKKAKQDIQSFDRVKKELTVTNMNTLKKMIINFIAQKGRTPQNLKEIQTFQPVSSIKVDAWGTTIRYTKIYQNRFRLVSAGKDGKFETEDDIKVGN